MNELLVFESVPLNAAVLSRLADVQLSEVRSLTQLEQTLRDRPVPRILAVEVTQETIPTIATLIHGVKSRARLAVIVMPDSTVHTGLTMIYEAGVDLVFRSMLDCPLAARLMARSLDFRGRNEDCDADIDFRTRVWRQIPWQRHATGGSSRAEKGNNRG